MSPHDNEVKIHAWKPSVLLVSLKLPCGKIAASARRWFRLQQLSFFVAHTHTHCCFYMRSMFWTCVVEVLLFFFLLQIFLSKKNGVVGGTCINGTFSLIPTYNNILLMEQIRPKKQLRLVVYPIIYWVSYMLGGARLLPSTVLHLMSWWKQMTQSTFSPSPPRAELFVDPSTSLSAWKATWKKNRGILRVVCKIAPLGGGFLQPIWKILYCQIGSSPQGFGVKIKKYLSCHHPDKINGCVSNMYISMDMLCIFMYIYIDLSYLVNRYINMVNIVSTNLNPKCNPIKPLLYICILLYSLK